MGYGLYFYLATWPVGDVSSRTIKLKGCSTTWSPRNALLELLKEALWKGQVPNFESDEYLSKCSEGSIQLTDNKFLLYPDCEQGKALIRNALAQNKDKSFIEKYLFDFTLFKSKTCHVFY